MFFFFQKNSERGGGGVSPNPKFSYQKKLRFFWNFFLKGGGVSPIPKGCYHKKMGILGYFQPKRGLSPNPQRCYQKKTENISEFFALKGGGSRQFRNFLIRKNWGFRIAERGGVSEFRSFSEEKKTFFFDASPQGNHRSKNT